ncbi:MAG: PhoX family phosphatase [Pseudomonadota bacterium]
MDASEDRPSNPRVAAGVETINDIIAERLSRRGFLAGLSAVAATGYGCAKRSRGDGLAGESDPNDDPVFSFTEIPRGADAYHHAPDDYLVDLVIRWGDGIFPDAPTYDPFAQTASAQERQFGYNNDFIGFYPLGDDGISAVNGLLCVNHEYTSTPLMFPGLAGRRQLSREQCDVELAAHGGSVVEVQKDTEGAWRPVRESSFNRRITGGSTEMEITGPAAGDDRMKTASDPTGRRVIGTLNNCAGGVTPWGTYLMAEENFNGCFMGELEPNSPETDNYARYGVPGGWYQWGRYIDRFDVSKTPNEPNRFGWVVEVDILDPESTPKKRTAMGRFKHEGAESVVAPDGRVVVYMGDDQRFDYVYKFITNETFDKKNRTKNMNLLDNGTLYVGRFDPDGGLEWMPLIYGDGPLTEENGFRSQADVMIDTRRAGDLLGATPMDRPEDVEPDPSGGRVFVMLTNNSRRTEEQIDAANPRAKNETGHIIEIIEPEGDFASTQSRWEILVRCGDPHDPVIGATWNGATSENGWFGSPDNCAVDPSGRLWVATDGNENTGANDGLWAVTTDGPERGTGRAFFRAPNGAEVCGPRFTPDGKTVFLSVQHPGDGDGASFENPTTRWPDFEEGAPPRPSVVAIRRKDGGVIGG